MKVIGYTVLSMGITVAVVVADTIIGVYFGVLYGFLSMAAELIIC